MSRESPTGPPQYPHWLLRRADQVGVAVLVLIGLAAAVAWWALHGGWRGRLIEVERAEPQVASFQVDINAADWPELVQMPGIGPILAQRIIETRQAGGPFKDHDDLRRRVRGIGPKTFQRIQPYLRPISDTEGVPEKAEK